YAGTAPNAKVYASADGVTWNQVLAGTGDTYMLSMAPFNGKLYAGTYPGKLYQISPVTATLSGADGTTAAQSLTATGLNLAESTNTSTCGGVSPCGATNQIIFTASDLGGSASMFGPFAVRVDALTPIAISTPSYPANGAYVNVQPNFDWIGPSS
ncbi:MAG: hypothetical protein NTX64_13855, partial [Elusimicrobia bacterium]|nr:hypothetical protein [Elusimicrobiota bacterium]